MAALTNLLRKATLNDDSEVLASATRALQQSSSNQEAQHAKLVALLKLDRYDEAARWLDGCDAQLASHIALERAYTLYKLGRWEEAATVAAAHAGRRALKHVEAQSVWVGNDPGLFLSLFGVRWLFVQVIIGLILGAGHAVNSGLPTGGLLKGGTSVQPARQATIDRSTRGERPTDQPQRRGCPAALVRRGSTRAQV